MDDIRKFRVQINPDLEGFMFNEESKGISLVDLLGTFLGFFILDGIFNIKDRIFKDSLSFYLSSIPIAFLSHNLVGQKTFLSNQLYSDINIYHYVFGVIIFYVVLNIKFY
jgi:hypothetical protein